MVLLSITGLFRTLLIILGVIILLRFVGRLMIAKRNIDEQNQMNKDLDKQDKMVDDARKNYGKTTLTNVKERADGKSASGKAGEFVDFEEVDD